MTPEQALDHLLNMSNEAPRANAFHETSKAAVQLLRSRLSELESQVNNLTVKLSESGTCTECPAPETPTC